MMWNVKFDEEVIGTVYTNHSMTAEEICETAGVDLAITEEDFSGMPENGKYDLDDLEIVDANKTKKYVFDFMFDKKSIGEQKIFDTESEAIAEKNQYISHLTSSEKEDLLFCRIYKAEITPEQMEEIEGCGISGELANEIEVREIWSL